MEQDQLIDEDRSQDEPSGRGQSPGWHLAMAMKDPLELLVEVLDCPRAQMMEDPPDFDPRIGVGIATRLSGHQDPLVSLPELLQIGGMVALVAQQEAQGG